MWPTFMISLLSEFFNESKEPSRFILKGFGSAVIGIIVNFTLLLLLSDSATGLVGYEISSINTITAEFVLIPFVVAFVALAVVKIARYFSNV